MSIQGTENALHDCSDSGALKPEQPVIVESTLQTSRLAPSYPSESTSQQQQQNFRIGLAACDENEDTLRIALLLHRAR